MFYGVSHISLVIAVGVYCLNNYAINVNVKLIDAKSFHFLLLIGGKWLEYMRVGGSILTLKFSKCFALSKVWTLIKFQH